MKIVKNNARIVCDVKGCDNFAGYKLILDSEGEESPGSAGQDAG